MAHSTKQGAQLLHGFKRNNRWTKGLGSQLPEAYRKFWHEWKIARPAAVHYIPKDGEWERDEVTGEIKPIQNIEIPLIDVPEANDGIWGGEAVIKGFQKRTPLKRRVPHFWVPVLKRTVLHSRVLNAYMSIVVTDRTMEQIHSCHGFDHYLLKNPACDLRSTLALKLKRKILLELLNGCESLADKPEEQQEVMKEYSRYLESYTPEEIDWYGLTFQEAIRKLQKQIREATPIVPHKVEYRMKLIEQLRKVGLSEAGTTQSTEAKSDGDLENLTKLEPSTSASSNWLSKINPFGKKQET